MTAAAPLVLPLEGLPDLPCPHTIRTCPDEGPVFEMTCQLPAGLAMGEPMSKAEAAKVLLDLADPDFVTGTRPCDLLSDRGLVDEMFRIAARQHHPDRGGDADLFRRANEARERLEATT